MAKDDRDKTGDVGSGQRKIIPPKKGNGHGKAKVEKDPTKDSTKPPTDKQGLTNVARRGMLLT